MSMSIRRALLSATLLVTTAVLLVPDVARAMCGCMLMPRPRPGETRAAKIVNKTSKVILARDGDTTVLTLANDFSGAPADFGLVVPVPTVIKKEDLKVVDDKVFVDLESQTAPRITEVFEPSRCMRPSAAPSAEARADKATSGAGMAARGPRASDYGVKVESHFFAGEYELAVLSGKDGSKLIEWLQLFNYDVPDDAKEVLGSYIKQNMMFFLARVHVKEMGNDRRHLRPIQVRYTTPKLMLPIRLGMVNADGPQELMVFLLTKDARVEPTNYRVAKMPTGMALPKFAKDDWTNVYAAMFDEQTKREDMRVVFLEDARWLSPPPGATDWKKAGVFWSGGAAFSTRLHFRYQQTTFPEDLVLQKTSDGMTFNVNMQAIVPAADDCPDPDAPNRRAREQQQLANLTGWDMAEVLRRAGGGQPLPPKQPDKWWNKIWDK